MSLDDLPSLAPTVDPGGRAYQERVIAAARKVLATTRCETDIPYRTDDYWQKLDIFLPVKAGDALLPVFCFVQARGRHGSLRRVRGLQSLHDERAMLARRSPMDARSP